LYHPTEKYTIPTWNIITIGKIIEIGQACKIDYRYPLFPSPPVFY
jgi:hypothetical protein